MTTPGTTVLRQRIVRVIKHQANASTDTIGVAAAARRANKELTAVFAPLISEAGVEALTGRAFDLAQREYPAAERGAGNSPPDEPFGRVTLWLEGQVPAVAIDAAAAMFAAFAELLMTLIGEPLTTRYLAKAWPEGFSDVQPKGKKA